jgi:hypothetical protein
MKPKYIELMHLLANNQKAPKYIKLMHLLATEDKEKANAD